MYARSLLAGKIHFGYIYGFGAIGCIAMYTVLNLMNKTSVIDMSRVFSVLGYSMLPIVALSAVNILVDLRCGLCSSLQLKLGVLFLFYHYLEKRSACMRSKNSCSRESLRRDQLVGLTSPAFHAPLFFAHNTLPLLNF